MVNTMKIKCDNCKGKLKKIETEVETGFDKKTGQFVKEKSHYFICQDCNQTFDKSIVEAAEKLTSLVRKEIKKKTNE